MTDSGKARRALFIDRDGTINREAHYLNRPEDLELIPGVPAALLRARRHGWLIIVITNQSGIARSYLTLETLEEIHDRLRREFGAEDVYLDSIYYCPHHPDEGCSCRKPQIGMIEQAAADHGIDPTRSWVIGDAVSDIGAGKAAGCRTVLVLTGHGVKSREAGCDPDLVVADLPAAIDRIIERESTR